MNTIYGNQGNDDLIGGSDVEFNLNFIDIVQGDEGEDYILGDNGNILSFSLINIARFFD